MNDRDLMEQQLLQLLEQHTEIYHAAVPVAEHLEKDYDLSQNCQNQMQLFSELMNRAFVLEKEIQPLLNNWTTKYQGQSTKLAAAQAKLQTLIEQLLLLTTKIEAKANACKDNLRPHINSEIQLRNAHSAYSNQ